MMHYGFSSSYIEYYANEVPYHYIHSFEQGLSFHPKVVVPKSKKKKNANAPIGGLLTSLIESVIG